MFYCQNFLGKHEVKMNGADCLGYTPSHIYLTKRQDKYAVELLTQNCTNVNAIRDVGKTPLHVTVAVEDARITQAGANLRYMT